MQLKELYIKSKRLLEQANVPEPAIEASSLLSNAIGLDKISIFSNPEMQIDESSVLKLDEFLNRRINGEPNSYITGVKEFYSKKFIVNKDVLIPRPETELIVEEALKIIPETREYFVVDVCTGSGCIGVALSSIRKNIRLISTDISFSAARVADKNAKLNQVDPNSISVNTNFLDCVKNRSVDMIVCNPPYVAIEDFFNLPSEVKNHEPRKALVGGEDGFLHIKEIISRSKEKLKNCGWLIIEIGAGQCQRTVEFFELSGYKRIDISLDTNSIERVIKAQWNES